MATYTTPQLVNHYKLQPVLPSVPHSRQTLAFKSWTPRAGDTQPPSPTNWSKPRAIQSLRFPNEYLYLVWAGRPRQGAELDPDKKNLADFVVLLCADRRAYAYQQGNVWHVMNRGFHIAWGVHTGTNRGAVATSMQMAEHNDGEHVTFNTGRGTGGGSTSKVNYHGYIIYPRGVPLGSSDADRRARYTNQNLTTADAAFTALAGQQNPSNLDWNISEPLGAEIFTWFSTEFTRPDRISDMHPRVMVYDPYTRIVEVYREGTDYFNSAPEHRFATTCLLPAEKLGLA